MSFYIKTHIVQKGETLETITSKYNIPDVEMLRYFHNQNCPKDSNHIGSIISAGQEIFIPEKHDIDRIVLDRKMRANQLFHVQQEKQWNRFLNFPFTKSNHQYKAILQEEGEKDTHSFTIKIEYVKTIENLYYLNISQSEIQYNNDVPDNSIELLASEINKHFYPLQIIVDEKGLIKKANSIFTIQQNWNSKKSDLYEFFPGEFGKKILVAVENKLYDSENLGNQFNLNIVWGLLFRGITGKYENGFSEKKINLLKNDLKFQVNNKMKKADDENIKFYEIEQKIYEYNNLEEVKIESLYILNTESDILYEANIKLFDIDKILDIKITKIN